VEYLLEEVSHIVAYLALQVYAESAWNAVNISLNAR